MGDNVISGNVSGSGEPAAPRPRSLLRSQARCALTSGATPRVRAPRAERWQHLGGSCDASLRSRIQIGRYELLHTFALRSNERGRGAAGSPDPAHLLPAAPLIAQLSVQVADG